MGKNITVISNHYSSEKIDSVTEENCFIINVCQNRYLSWDNHSIDFAMNMQ